jgi:hypothetical protein
MHRATDGRGLMEGAALLRQNSRFLITLALTGALLAAGCAMDLASRGAGTDGMWNALAGLVSGGVAAMGAVMARLLSGSPGAPGIDGRRRGVSLR